MPSPRNISFTDEELVSRYKSTSDLQVLGQLYERYMDLVYGICLKYLREPEDAKDAVINIFEELVTKLQRHEVINFKNWLYQLAKNHSLMKLRAQKRTPIAKIDVSLVQSEENTHLNGALEKEENFRQLQYCMEQLAGHQKKVIELFYLEGKCYNQISGLTGLEWTQVRSYLQNGRRNLKICMEKRSAETVLSNK